MEPGPATSVVIVTRHRPDDLALTLAALRLQRDPGFEVVVVGPPGTLAPPALAPFRGAVRFVTCAEPNIARARNLGLAAAGGDLVAFLDDDARPEPSWLAELARGFLGPEVGAVGGFVLGRNGVAWQWQALGSDPTGRDVALPLPPGAPAAVPDCPPGVVPKPPGTNMAFRREALRAIGGFCEHFRFFLEETDAHRRLAAAGWRIAFAPRAVVHHAFAASDRRRADRVPRDLHEIGASLAVFLDRHAPGQGGEARAAFRAEQRARLLRHVLAGRIEPREMHRLLAGLEAGFAEGAARHGAATATFPDPPAAGPGPFPRAAGPRAGQRIALLAPPFRPAGARAAARLLAAEGAEVSLLETLPWPARLSVRFAPEGYWRHSIGAFGRTRTRRLRWPVLHRKQWTREEVAAIHPLRDFTHAAYPAARSRAAANGVTCITPRRGHVYNVETLTCLCHEPAVGCISWTGGWSPDAQQCRSTGFQWGIADGVGSLPRELVAQRQ